MDKIQNTCFSKIINNLNSFILFNDFYLLAKVTVLISFSHQFSGVFNTF